MSHFRDKDIQQFQVWMDEYGNIPHKVACLHSYSNIDRADLRQEMLVQLWRSLPRFKHQCKTSTWIYRVCLNTALTWKRDEGRRKKRLKKKEAFDHVEALTQAQGTGAAEDRMESLYAAIRNLPVLDRNLIQLSLDGLSYLEMSEVTGLKESNVGSRLTRARQQLAQLIKED